MDFGISFWTFGTGDDANVFLTDTFLSPIALNPNSYSDYSLSFNNGYDYLLFSGNKINNDSIHHICLNFSNTGLSSYIDSEKCFQNILAGDNTGNYGFTGIISLFSGFNGYSVNDLIILNRTFEDSEISGIYNKDIWDFYEAKNSIYDFSTVPLRDRESNISQIYSSISQIYTGRAIDYFSYYYLRGEYTTLSGRGTSKINIENGFSIFSWFAYIGNYGVNYIYKNEESNKQINFGLSGEKLFCSLVSGNVELSSLSNADIPKSGWNFIGCSCDSGNIVMYLNDKSLDSTYINRNNVYLDIESGVTMIGFGGGYYIDEILLF